MVIYNPNISAADKDENSAYLKIARPFMFCVAQKFQFGCFGNPDDSTLFVN